MTWLGKVISTALQRRADAETAEILGIIINPPPERIIYSKLLRKGHGYEIDGSHFDDGLPRLFVATGQHLAPAVLEAFDG